MPKWVTAPFLMVPVWLWVAGLVVAALVILSMIRISARRVGADNSNASQPILLPAGSLPSLTGSIYKQARIAKAGVDTPGYITYGPYLPLADGDYEIRIRYQSETNGIETAGAWDVRDADRDWQIAAFALPGTLGKPHTVSEVVRVRNGGAHKIEVRILWNGSADFRVEAIEIALRAASGAARSGAAQPIRIAVAGKIKA